MILVGRSDVELLFRHYEEFVDFVPGVRYFMRSPFAHYNYDGFSNESLFRRTLVRVKPLFIANQVEIMDVLIFDLDFKMSDFSEASFIRVSELVKSVIEMVDKAFVIESGRVVFSGRGFHIYVVTSVHKELLERLADEHVVSKSPFVNIYELAYEYIPRKLYWKFKNAGYNVNSVFDRTTISVNKLMRTVGSINDRSFLPVVSFDIDSFDVITLDDVLYGFVDPNEYRVRFRRPTTVRVYDTFEKFSDVIVDGYELLRQLILNNYNVVSYNLI